MKKSLALVAMLAIALAACGKKEEAKPVEVAPAAPAAAPAADAPAAAPAAPAADAKK
jgi:predicted small lipoprotein YifL